MLGLGLNFGSSQSGSSAARMGGPALLLDTYTEAAAAYSLRKLKSDYTGKVLQVRRASDHVEVDVGFDSDGLLSLDSPVTNVTEESTGITQGSSTNAAKLGEFCGEARRSGGDTSYATVDSMTEAAHVEVVTWYDQSGNTNNATQAAASRQPRIYDRSSGLIVENGDAAMSMDYHFLMTSAINTNTFSIFAVGRSSGDSYFMNRNGSNNQVRINEGGIYYLSVYPSSKTSDAGTTYTQQLAAYIGNSSTFRFFQNSTAIGTAAAHTINQDALGGFTTSTQPTTMFYQELVVYTSDQYTAGNQTSIESNINTFYSIY